MQYSLNKNQPYISIFLWFHFTTKVYGKLIKKIYNSSTFYHILGVNMNKNKLQIHTSLNCAFVPPVGYVR